MARADGDTTRQQILEVAGKLFAESGYDAATSKQVCTLAEVNLAAVNYHFGGKEGLYSAVLVEAHRRLLSLDELSAIADSDGDARGKLGRVIDRMIDGMGTDGWHLRVYAREIITPSPSFGILLTHQVIPKLGILKDLLCQITAFPPEDPVLARCFLTTFAPCLVLLIANKTAINQVMPGIWEDKDALKQHVKTFVLAGCESISHTTSVSKVTPRRRSPAAKV